MHQQLPCLVRPAGDHHAGENLGIVEAEPAGNARDAARRHAEQDRAAARLHVFRRRFGEQAPEVGARDQEIARLARGREAVAQHVDEDLGGGALDGRVERRNAQGFPDAGAQRAGLSVLVEQPRDAAIGQHAEIPRAQRNQEARRAKRLGEGQLSRAEQRGEQIERVGEPRRPQVKSVGVAQLERQPQEKRARVGADLEHQAQRLAIRADKDVLAVVEVDAVYAHAARAAAQAARGFEDRYADALLGEGDRGSESGPAGADDRGAAQAVTQVRHAIQSLRIGVSAVRCSSTRKSSPAISSSSAR